MLTADQIQELARKNRIGVHPQEREYIQNIFLYLLYTKYDHFVFKGGTALKIIYGSPRFSEDLDFNSNLSLKEAEAKLKETVADLKIFGIEAQAKEMRGQEGQGFGFKLAYKGPLYDGRDQTKSSIRIDVSLRKEKLIIERQLLRPLYPDIGTFTIACASLADIFAEKIRAMLVRGKPRDLYDLWFLSERGAVLDEKLINKKLKIYSLKFDKSVLAKEINREKKAWKQDLQSLLPQLPDFEIIKQKLIKKLNN